MRISQSSEYPKPPLPKSPIPEQPKPAEAPQPMIYVYEHQEWEYKIVSKDAAAPLSEEELNAIGKKGWELVGVLPVPLKTNFYFKRARQ